MLDRSADELRFGHTFLMGNGLEALLERLGQVYGGLDHAIHATIHPPTVGHAARG